jgi:excisionase family DNA binding protein
MNTQTLDPVLTSEAARILEVSPETIRNWERAGILLASKTGSGVRVFDRGDVDALKQQRAARQPHHTSCSSAR